MKSESPEASSSSKSFCDDATSAVAVSSQSLIDEDIISKTEEIHSSSKKITRVKKEEEIDDDDSRGDRASASASAIAMNYDLNRSVKKEEELENNDDDDTKMAFKEAVTGAYYGDDDHYDYSDWKAGDWCWLLPAVTDNNGNRQKQPGGGDATAVTTKTDVTPTTTGFTGRTCSTTRSTGQIRYIDDAINEDENAAAEPIHPPPKNKIRRKENSTEKDGINIKIAAVYNESGNDDDIDIKEEAEEGSGQHRMNSTVNDNDNDNTNTDASINNYNDDGYESWTEGNWCLLLSPLADDMDETKNITSSKLSANAETTTNTCNRRRSCGSSPNYLEVGDVDVNEGDKMDYDDDEGDDDNDDNDEPTKKTKSTTTYKKWQNERWKEMFQKIVNYKMEHKSTNVPARYAEDPKLGNWVMKQRKLYKHNKELSQERINSLESVGFIWNPLDAQWMEMYQKLVAYKKNHMSTNVSRGFKEDPKLGMWVFTQRNCYNQKDIYIDRVNLLESIGFIWDPRDA
jgi:hypothetical protein